MLIQVIDGFAQRIKQAVEQRNYEELKTLDAACLGFLSKNLKQEEMDENEKKALENSLNSLAKVYRGAISLCDEERGKFHSELHAVGRAHRSASQYLSVASSIGR